MTPAAGRGAALVEEISAKDPMRVDGRLSW
jgi:hypothetical protein